ncbi:RDD family protein [Glycomyces tarimensis]
MTHPPPHPGFQLGSQPPPGPGPFGGDAAAPTAPVQPGPKAGRKIAARAVDAAIGALVVSLVATLTFQSIGERASNLVPAQAIGAVVDVLFSGGDVEAATDEVGTSVWNMVVSRIRGSIFILIGLHLLYETGANLWKGRTLGRMLLDLRIAARGRSGVGFGRALVRAVVTVACTGSLYGLAWIVLLQGDFMGGLGLWLLPRRLSGAGVCAGSGRVRRTAPRTPIAGAPAAALDKR